MLEVCRLSSWHCFFPFFVFRLWLELSGSELNQERENAEKACGGTQAVEVNDGEFLCSLA